MLSNLTVFVGIAVVGNTCCDILVMVVILSARLAVQCPEE
jgi:hypothetical protein